jgi:hypothetical protein
MAPATVSVDDRGMTPLVGRIALRSWFAGREGAARERDASQETGSEYQKPPSGYRDGSTSQLWAQSFSMRGWAFLFR